MKRTKIPVNKTFSGGEYRAMGHALYYLLNYKGGPKSEAYAYMASPKAMQNLAKISADWLNAQDFFENESPDVTMTLPTEVTEAIASFLASIQKPKVKKVKKVVLSPVVAESDIPF